MSAFNIVSPIGAPDQKKMLLERLMQQYQQASSRAAGLATGARTGRPFGGTLPITRPTAALAPGLAALLGPGAIGTPGASETSPGRGLAIAAPIYTNSHAGSVLSVAPPIPFLPGPPGGLPPGGPEGARTVISAAMAAHPIIPPRAF